MIILICICSIESFAFVEYDEKKTLKINMKLVTYVKSFNVSVNC